MDGCTAALSCDQAQYGQDDRFWQVFMQYKEKEWMIKWITQFVFKYTTFWCIFDNQNA